MHGTQRSDMSDCVFCRILAGELPASFVYRDDQCAAFMDIRPVNFGHLLVIPIRHAAYLADIDASEAADVMKIGHAAAAALRASGVRCEGVNLFLADGEAAMQEVFHVHLHVIPRFRGDGFSLKFSPEYYTRRPERTALDEIASTLSPLMASQQRRAAQQFTANDELALHVPDPAAAESFYVDTLGCVVFDRAPDCISLKNGALRMYLLRDPHPSHEQVVPSFDVKNRAEALARLQAAGCSLVPIGPHAPGEHYVRDPFGILFDVVERRTPA
jgi:histidine triad (HIT) family protein